ncbi:MAG: radical SAM/SPASM domain-containing protein [Bacteroidota bacterium]
MAIRYNYGRKGVFRNALYQLRRAVPRAVKLRVWKRTSAKVFDRRDYAAKVPLFRSIELETRTRCNSSCSFCAASILTDTRPDIYMPDALYEKIIDELAALNYDGHVKFFVNNEPLLDKRTAAFIRLVKERVPAAFTEVHTNGLKLNPRNGRELLEAGLDYLYINNYTEEGQMHRGVRKFLDEVAPDFPEVQIVFHMRLLKEQLLNRGGTAPNGVAEKEPLPLPCVLPFDEVVVTADGRVTICCQDHYFEAAVGNVNAQPLAEIWYSEGFQKLRAQLLEGDRSGNDFCKVCDFRGYKEEHLTKGESMRNRMVGALLHGSG